MTEKEMPPGVLELIEMENKIREPAMTAAEEPGYVLRLRTYIAEHGIVDGEQVETLRYISDLRARAREMGEQLAFAQRQLKVYEENVVALRKLSLEAEQRASLAESRLRAAEGDADGCICKGNWRAIVKECEPLFGKRYRDDNGNEYTFFGVVHSDDDYYYGMTGEAGMKLLSCVGSIENFGFTLVSAARGR